MNPSGAHAGSTVRAATLCAFAMIGNQIAGKAVRDSLFLSQFSIETLPRMVVVSAVLSLVAVLIASRLLRARGPARLVPLAFVASALNLALMAVVNAWLPRPVAVGLYLHVAVFGAILVSWFWSLLNECFDARAARTHVARIAAGGTLGGLVGGIVSERIGAWFTPDAMLPILAALHIFSAVMATRIVAEEPMTREVPTEEAEDQFSWFDALSRSSYLRNLASLVLLGTLGAAFLDFVFKVFATQAYVDSPSLLRFFAGFYTIAALAAFVAQTFVVPRLMRTPQDLTRNIALLPLVVLLGCTVALLLPTLAVVVVVRGLESVMRNSFYRSSYEVFFNPISASQKRSAKTVIDVGFERCGDLVGGLLIQAVVLLVGASAGVPYLLAATILITALTLWRMQRLRGGYIESLEGRIRDYLSPRASEQERVEMTQSILLSEFSSLQPTLSGLSTVDTHSFDTTHSRLFTRPSARVRRTANADADPAVAAATPFTSTPFESAEERLQELRSADPGRVRRALADPTPLNDAQIDAVIPLLAWDALYRDVAEALRHNIDRCAARLVETLHDPSTEFSIRRRIPPILVVSRSATIVNDLLKALTDKRFEVRYQVALAVARIHRKDPEIAIDPQAVLGFIASECKVDQRIWNKRQLLDVEEIEDAPFYRDVLDRRTHKSLEHLFHLLSLAYPLEPLRVAYDGLHTGDDVMRSTSLEYLESILPADVRRSLLPLLGGTPSSSTVKSNKEALDSLLMSHESILLQLQKLKQSDG